MIICDDPRTVVLHVPRTGGTAIRLAVQRHRPDVRVLINEPEIHAGIEDARKWFGERQYIVIMRSPWEIMASIYSLFRHFADREPRLRPSWFTDTGHLSAPRLARSFGSSPALMSASVLEAFTPSMNSIVRILLVL